MKKPFALLLILLLLTACGAPAAPPEEGAPPEDVREDLAYEVFTRTVDDEYRAKDGQKLLHVHFELPQLAVLAGGEELTEAKTDAQKNALRVAETFNALFGEWQSAAAIEDDVELVNELYENNPSFFQDVGEDLSEELTYTAYRLGDVVSISAAFYSFLGGVHPNTSFFSWNYDLQSGAFFKVPELAEDPQAFTAFVADTIEAQAREQVSELTGGEYTMEELYWEDYRDTMDAWADAAVFFGSEGMTVLFSAYELASYAAGPQEFLLTYDQLAPYWSESGRAVLGLRA